MAGEAVSGPWEITADKIIRHSRPENIVAEGNVVLQRRGNDDGATPLTIKADWIRYNMADGVVHARGHLSMRNINEDVDADEAVFDLNKETATLTETTLYVPKNNLHFTGTQVEKTDAITYRFQDGTFTTCKTQEGVSPPWQFSSADTVVTLEKSTVLKHSLLRIKGVPVFYFPYLIIPGNTKRRTGFLLPEFSQSELSGLGVITPFFIDLSPSSDITLYPGYLAKRGVYAGTEFRYVADENSRVTVAGTYIQDKSKDRAGDDYKDDGYLRTDFHRYWVRGKLDHDFGDDLIARADIDITSDRDYIQEFKDYVNDFKKSDKSFFKDFNRGLAEESLPYRSSQLQLGKTWPSSFLGGQMIGINDHTDNGGGASQVNTLPRLLFNGVFELQTMPISLSWNSEYVNYYRDEGVGEQRLHVHPRLTAPLPLGPLIEGTVSSGVQETLYWISSHGSSVNKWQFDNDQLRSAWDFNANVATTMARDFDLAFGNVAWLNHAVRPEIDYTYVSVSKQDTLPDIDNVDRISLTNLLTYSVNNYFRLGGTDKDGLFNRYIGYLKIEQSYDVHEERRELSNPADKREPFSDINLNLNIYPFPGWQAKYETAYSVYGDGVTGYDLYTKYSSRHGNFISLDYRYTKRSDVNQVNAEIGTKLTNALYLEGDIKQSLSTDEITSASLGIVYHPQCWAVKLQAEKNSDDKRLVLMFSMTGLGKTLGYGFEQNMEGKFDFDSGSDGLELD